MSCKKVSFLNEEFALKYINKLYKTSTREKKPVNTYLCEICLNWHLTSIESKEIKEVLYLKRQIENLKNKVIHLDNEIIRLNKIIEKNSPQS